MTNEAYVDPVLRAYVDAVANGEAAALATVVKNQTDSGPAVGTKFVVWRDGRTMGTLGSPELEAEVAEDAITALNDGESRTILYPKAALRTRRVEELAQLEIFIEVMQAPHLVVVGGGHVGYYTARLGKMVGFQVSVVDDRPDFANRERFPEMDNVICEDFVVALENMEITEDTYFVIVTRGHKQDELALKTVINSAASYVGMIGSKRRVNAVLTDIHHEGVPIEKLAKVRTPIGLDIGAETPQELAVSIIGEIIMHRKGGTGVPMSKIEHIPIVAEARRALAGTV